MVAVITGNGLGLGNTSLTQLGQTQGGSPSLGQAANNSYVNTATGNLVMQTQDEGLLFDGLPLNVLRTYNSLGQLSSNGWSYGFSRNLNGLTGTLNTAGSTITRTDDDGSSVVYSYNASLGVYVSTDQSGAVDTLSWNATSSTWTFNDAADNIQETYNATGQLTALTDTASGASYNFSYSNGQLSQIVAGDGDTLIFGYNTSNQLISLSIQEVPPGQSTAVTRQAVSYGYDSQGRLSTVTTTLASDTDSSTASYTTTYTYQGSTDLVASVTQSDGTTVSYTYTQDAQGAYQVTGVTTGTGAAAQSVTLSYGVGSTTVTDGLGHATTYQYNAAGELTQVTASAVNGVSPTVTYTYDANGNLLTSTDPDGAVTSYSYDANGNLLSVEDGAGNTVSYTYNADDQVTSKTTYTTPAQGEVGQSGYVAPSGAQTTYYIYNATNQLAYTIDALGNVSENDYATSNGLSERVSSRQYLGATYSTSSNTPSNPPALADLQAWVQSAAVQGTLSQSTRTDYSYDVRGQLATQTLYDTVDANGNGVLTNGTVITTTTYDAQGKLLQTSTETGANRSTLQTTSYSYDGLGRLVSSTDPQGNVTSYVYTDSAHTIAITQANGLTTTQVRNSAGMLISSTQSGTGQTPEVSSYLYNADGEQIAAIDAKGNVTYTFYDADGRVTGTVDGAGHVISYTYDADGQVVSTTHYANTVATSTWIHSGTLTSKLPASLPLPAANAADATTTAIYDAAGNVVASINANNDVTITAYDGAGNAVASTQYATALTSAQRTALGTAPTLAALQADITTSASDATTHTIYDADNRPIATIDPRGVVSTVTYDAAGDVVGSRTYMQELSAAQVAALGNEPTLANLLSVLSTSAFSAQTLYNANHQPVATIAANGDVTITTYDGNGNAVAVTQYVTPLTAAQLAALGSTPTLAAVQADVTPGAGDLTSLTVYSASNQPVATISASGDVTITTYDSNGNVVAKTQYATPLTADQLAALGNTPTLAAVQANITTSANDQTTLTVYNASNQVVATVSPAGIVTVISYDSNGNAVASTQYATALTADQLTALGDTPTLADVQADITTSANDLTTLTIYNASNQAVATVSPNGSVTVKTYDDSGNVIASVAYAAPLTAVQMTALSATPTLAELQAYIAANEGVQTALTLYNSNEQPVAVITPSGSVTITSYDGAGHVTSVVQYANPLTATQVAALSVAPTLAALQADLVPSTTDNISLTAYNANEQVVASVSGNGQVTTTTYDAAGNVSVTTQYSTLLTQAQMAALGTAPTLSAITADLSPNAADINTITIYDANERPVAKVTGQMEYGYFDNYEYYGYFYDTTVVLTTYDTYGNAVSTTTYSPQALNYTAVTALAAAPSLATLQSDLGGLFPSSSKVALYDSNGNLLADVVTDVNYNSWEGLYYTSGWVDTSTYDAAGKVTTTTSYASPLTISQLQTLLADPTLATLQSQLTSNAPQECSLTIYDANERPVAHVSSTQFYDSSTGGYVEGGDVVITTYDAAGNITAVTQYANPLTDAQIEALGSSPTLAALQADLTPSASDQTTLTVYDANELPVATVSSSGAVTVTSYDAAGNVTAVTQYANSLTSAQISALGTSPTLAQVQADLVPSTHDLTTLTVYDDDEDVVATINSNRYVTVTFYDATGNITVTTEYANRLTAAQFKALGSAPTLAQVQADLKSSANDKYTLDIYDPGSNREATVATNGQVVMTTYDSNGNAIAKVSYATLLTSAQIASLASNPDMAALQGMLTPGASDAITPPANFVDANGNVVATVAANGTVTTTEYDNNGNVTSTRQYATPLTWSQLEALAASPTLATLQANLNPGPADQVSLTIYDANGHVLATVASDGNVQTWAYDAAGNVTATTQYATPLTVGQINSLGSAPTLAELQGVLSTSPADRTSLTIYNSHEQVVATVNASGNVVTMSYDATGNVVQTTSYTTTLSQAQIARLGVAPTMDLLQIDLAVDTGASESQAIYNTAGQPVATISASGQVTVTTYDAAGNITASTQYANPLVPGYGYISTLSQLLSIVQPSAADITTRTIYDADNRPIATIANNGQVTLTTYSADGSVATNTIYGVNLTSAQMASLGNSPSMANLEVLLNPTSRAIYNAAGEPVAIINAEGNASYKFYNNAGQLIGTVDADGAVTAYAYDADGNLTQATQYATLVSTTGWLGSNGQLSGTFPTSLPTPTASANDRTTTKVYDSVGQVVATIDPEGNVTTTTYDASGDALSTTAYATPLTAAQLAALGSAPTLAAVQADLVASANDRTTVAIYDADGNAVATIDPSGYVTISSYDADGNVVQQTAYATALTAAQLAALGTTPSLAALQADITASAQDQTTHNYYNGLGQLVAQVDADGYLTVNTYNEAGNRTSSTRYGVALSTAQLASLTTNESVGALEKLLGTNPTTETSSAIYDAEGRLIRSVAVDGTVTAYTYDNDGNLLSTVVVPVAGQGTARTTRATYDALGDMLTSTDANGRTTTYVYNVLGQRIESTDALGNSTWYYYDADGQLAYTVQGQPSATGQLNAVGNLTAYVYDAFGDVTSVTHYASQLTLVSDQASSGIQLDPASAGLSDLAAAVASLPASISDANDVTTTTYTADGQVATTVDGDGYETANTYDAFGDLIQTQQQLSQAGQALTTGNSTVTRYTYDARGEQTIETDGVGTSVARTTSSTYDAFGRVTSSTDGNGNTIAYSYDKLGRQVSSSQVVQGVTRSTQSTYDAYGNVLTQTDALGHVTTYQYNLSTHTVVVTTPDGVTMTTVKDAFGDVVSVTDGAGNTTRYTYDRDGDLLTTTDALGDVSTNLYNVDDELVRTTDATGHVVIYTYNASGQVLSRRVDPTGQDQVTTYVYDGEGRQVKVTDPIGIVTTYTYDADGNTLIQEQDAGSGTGKLNLTTVYTYDGEGHVLTTTGAPGTAAATTTQFVYDALGRLTQKIVDPAGLALTSSYVYDADNNVVQSTDADGNSTYAVYNEADQAVFVIKPVGAQGAAQGAITQNTYDADGNLVSSHVYANAVSTSGLGSLASGSTSANLATVAALASAASSSSDTVSYSVYNADGQVIYQIDPMGNVTETRYNALGQAAETLAYASPITVSTTLASALQAGTAQASDIQTALSSAGDSDASARVSYAYYDADGRVAYTVTPNLVDGVLGAVVSQTQYDAAGRVIANIDYGVPLPMADVGTGSTTASIAQAVAQANTAATTRSTQYIYNGAGEQAAQIDPNGNVSYTFYNRDGQVAVTVDATGSVVQYTRDALGRVVRQTSYAQQANTAGWLSNGVVTVTAAQAIPTGTDPTANRVTVTSYDALGRVSKVTHYSNAQYNDVYNPTTGQWNYQLQYLDGDSLSYTYDAASRVTQATDVDLDRSLQPGSGETRSPTRTTRYFYDGNGNTIATLNADGYLTTNRYDAAGNLLQTVAYATAVNATVRAKGTLAQLVPPSSANDQVTTYYYDVQGRRVGSLDADGYFTQYSYDEDGDQLASTRYATALSLSMADSLDAITAALAGTASHQTIYTYDAYGDVLSTQDYQGTVTQYAYDDLGNVVQTTVAAGTGDARTSGSTYDAFGNVVSTADGMGNVTTYTYDLAGNKTSMTDALGNTTWYVYDADNRVAFTIHGMAQNGTANVLGEVSANIYDAFGDVLQTTAYSELLTLGNSFSPTLASMQNAVSTLADNGPDADGTVSYQYDLEGNVVTKMDGDDNQVDYSYDGFNELIDKQQPGYNGLTSLYTYDAMGNMTSEVDEVGASCGEFADVSTMSTVRNNADILRTQEWTYDAFGNIATYTDGDGATTTYHYDGLNQQLSQSLTVSGQLRETQTSYDAYGRVLSTTDAMGLVTTYNYNDADRSVTVTAPGGITTSTSYNREGQKIAVTDAAGNTTSYQYDADGRLLETISPDGNTTNQYDAVGNVIQSMDADGHVTAYTYDAEGRVLTQTVDPHGLKLITTYTYDGRGLNISVTDPTGIATTYTYDGAGNLSRKVEDAGSAAGDLNISTNYWYSQTNELSGSQIVEVVNGETQYDNTNYQYDALGRLTSESQDTGGSSQTLYTYDPDGNLVAETNGNGYTTYYVYNEAGQQIYAITPTSGNDWASESWQTGYVPATGAVTQTTYNADGQVVSTTQYATELTANDIQSFQNAGAPTASTVASMVTASPDDRTSYQVYNAAGQLQYSIDATGAVVETLYNSAGQVSETLAYPNVISVSPTLANILQAGTATVANIQSALSAAGNSDAAARATYTYYDDMGRVSLVISSASLNGQGGGLVKQTQYDADGNVIAQIQYGALIPLSQVEGNATTASISQYLAGATDMHVTRTVYDAAGRKVYTIDADNNVTEMQYDGDGRVTWTLNYANPIGIPAAWNVADVAAAVQTANAGSLQTRGTENVYDGVGNIVATYSMGNGDVPVRTSAYTYDDRGLKLSYTDADGNTWRYNYDYYGNLTQQISPPVSVASYNGMAVSTTQQSIITSYRYDSDGNRISETDGAGTALARTTNYYYDAANNLIQTVQPDAGQIDPVTGQLVATGVTPAITITYNAFGEATVSQDANGSYAYNVYNADGELAYAIDGDGYVTGYQYDAYGDQTAVTRYATAMDASTLTDWSAGQPISMEQMASILVTSDADRTVTTTYDAQGNKLSVTEPAITYTNSDGTTAIGSPVTQYTYDAYGNVTSQSVLVQGTPGQSNAVWATTYNYYDTLGNKLMSVDPMGYVTTNSYDAFGDVLGTTQWATAMDTAGLVAGGAMPSDPSAGVAATTGLDRTTNYTYDNNGNKSSQSVQRSYTNAQGQSVVGWDTTTYGYDGNKHLTTVTENGNTVTTAYDALGRVASITGPQIEVLQSNWQAQLEANPSLTLASYGPPLYVLASQVVSYTYDALGNKLVQTQSSTGSSQTVNTYYQYDNAGRLVAQITPLDGSGPSWTSDQTSFTAYDADGNVTSQWYTLDGNDGSTVTVTTTNTYDADNQQTSSVIWRAGMLSPDKSTSTTYDAFGEVTASGDGVNTNVATTYDNAGNKLTSNDPKTGEVHTYGYNLAGQMVTDTVPVAASAGGGTTQTRYTLDLDGRITAEQAPSTNAATGENASLHASYDAWGNVLSSTDANGNITSYSYNERNDVVTETEASVTVANVDGTNTLNATPVKTSAYDIDGNLIASKDENGNVIQNIYNALGQKTESIDGVGNTLYTSYDALGNQVAQQDGNGNITFSNVDALGRTVQSGEFELASGGSTRQAVWQQAYVLDQNGDRIISYDGIGSAYLQSGDTADAALHANYNGYDSQGRVIWSQDAAQRAASTSEIHGIGNYGSGSWTTAPTNANFSDGSNGWTMAPGYATGSFTTSWDGTTVIIPSAPPGSGTSGGGVGVSPTGGDSPEIQTWSLEFTGTNNPNNGSGNIVNNDRVPVTPGQTITANASFIVMGDHGGGAVQIIFYDANGNSLGGPDNNSIVSAGHGPGTSTLTATAPPGAAYATVGIDCTNYNLPGATVYCSGVSWNYEPPAYITSLGLDNGSPVITLPGGSFTDQVTNSNFAEGNVGWDTNGWTIHQASNANSGWEASFGGNGSATMVNQDRVPVVPGQTINGLMRLGLYLAPNNAEASGQIAINWYDANGNLIKQDTGNLVDNDHKGAWESSSISATAPPGAAYAALAVIGTANGIGSVSVESVQWNYQYVPQVPTGVVQDTYNYDVDGNLISETTADGDTESWQYNQYGQVTQHTDLSGAQYNYTYDANTGEQIGESDNWSPAGQKQVAPSYVTAPLNTPNSETLTYYADGQIATESFSDGSSYSYQYDANGNLISEEDTTVDGNNNTVHTLTQTTYDSHNRVSTVTETNEVTGATMLQESFSYDAAGNRREVKATSGGTTQDAWYTYDKDNRAEVTDGSLQSGQIVITDSTGSYQNAYDADGNVVKIFTRNALGDLMSQSQSFNAQNELMESQYAVDVTQGATSNGVDQIITYDADGHALVTQTYYEVGATVQSNGQSLEVGTELESATVDFYDVVGRLAESQTFNTPSNWDGSESAPPTGTPNPDATTYGSLQLQSEVVYQGPNGTSGYDADGDVVAYQYRDNNGRVDQYQVNYLKKDSYLQADTTGDSNTANVQPATDQTIYDSRGNEVALAQQNEDPYGNIANTVHVFAYNGDGEIIEREDGTATSGTTLNLGSNPGQEVQHYTYVNGQQLAHFDNAGTLDVLDQVTAFSSNNDSPDSYVVQTGDTLESIAQAEYGNANLWYVIAQANDLSSDTNLAFGQRLQIPAVTTHSNSSATFKPYDPSSIVGSTTPSLPTIAPPPPPAHNGGCSAAEILVIVVTVVVTIVTYGATSELLYGEAAALTAGEAATVGAIAGAAGSIAGQLTGMATGIQSGFNWGAVAEGAIGGAIGGAVTSGLANSGIPSLTSSTAGNGLSWLGDAVQGAATYAGNDLAAKLTDQPEHFSWAGLVASSVAAVASGELGPTRADSQAGASDDNYFDYVSARAAGDIVDREVSIALGDEHVPSWAQVGEDIAGYAIGQPIGEAIKAPVVQAIKAYQDQQLANTVSAFNANFNANLVAGNQQLNNMLWNQISTSVTTELNSEGQAALDAAWTQTQANAAGSSDQATDTSNGSSPSPQASASPSQSNPGTPSANSNGGSSANLTPWYLVNATTQSTTWDSSGAVTVTATIPHEYTAYDLDLYIGSVNRYLSRTHQLTSETYVPYYDRRTSNEEATMAMGNIYQKILTDQKNGLINSQTGQYQSKADIQATISQVEHYDPAWNPQLGYMYSDPEYPTSARNPFVVEAGAISSSSGGATNTTNSNSTNSSSGASSTTSPSGSAGSQGSMPSIPVDTGSMISPSDLSIAPQPLSLNAASVMGPSMVHIEPLSTDSIQLTLGNEQAPPNFFTVPANTMPAQPGIGVSLSAPRINVQSLNTVRTGQPGGGSYVAPPITHTNQITKPESGESDDLGEALDTVDQMLGVSEKTAGLAAKVAGFANVPGDVKNAGSNLNKAAWKREAGEAAEVLKDVSKEAEDAMKPLLKAAKGLHIAGNFVSVGSSVLDVTKAKDLNDGIRIVAEDSTSMVAEEGAAIAGEWIGGGLGALIGMGALDAITVPAGMWVGGVLGILAYNFLAKDALKSKIDELTGLQPPKPEEARSPSQNLPVTSLPNE